jgi:protein arginine kinase
MEKENKNESALFGDELTPWSHNRNPIWLASTLQLNRNIEKFNFPAKLDADRRKQMVSLIRKEMGDIEGLRPSKMLKTEECSPIDREFLAEHFMSQETISQALQGEAFVVDAAGSFLITVNIEDHLHFLLIDLDGELEKGWNRLASLESQLGKHLNYSYSPKFGFLTSNPAFCGTGLKLTAFLQLSALLHTETLKTTLEKMQDDAISVSGLMAPHEFLGDLVAVRNQYTLGVNEEGAISSLRSFVTKLMGEEHSARAAVFKQQPSPLKDKVARAYALLLHSYQIETFEALNEIALLKFGLEMQWISGITISELNQLFFTCRRGHLLRLQGAKVPMEEIGHKRAEFIHKTLKNVTLKV